MSMPFPLAHSLGTIPLLTDGESRSISAENPDGARGGGGKAKPDPNEAGSDLPLGWKARPCLTLEPNSLTTIAEIDGPGVIQQIWITVDPKRIRDIVLRCYWDGEETPSIEVPLGDFFCCGNASVALVNSQPICVNPKMGLNTYWPMPFRKSCKITIENQWPGDKIIGFFYQINYVLQDVPAEAAYFHAQFNRTLTSRDNPEHVLVDNVTGPGHYVGTYLLWQTSSDVWWGEGELKFFLDGDGQYPTICGTGTEDYFGGAWGFYDDDNKEQPYSTPYMGLPYVQHHPQKTPKYGMYRWHILDPVRFKQNLKATVQALGWWPNGKFQPLCDDISSVAYWYQAEPHGPFPTLPDVKERWPR